ncbi:unnamed protein product, partial [Amoebophrya sp. A25]
DWSAARCTQEDASSPSWLESGTRTSPHQYYDYGPSSSSSWEWWSHGSHSHHSAMIKGGEHPAPIPMFSTPGSTSSAMPDAFLGASDSRRNHYEWH